MLSLRRAILICVIPLSLAGCAAKSVWSTQEEIQMARYTSPEPPSLTLYTMVNNRSGGGGHSALMVNASQKVIFDPAGTVNEKGLLPERNDVLYGINPAVEDFYTRAHARETHHVVIQEIQVSPEVAELALKLVQDYGAVPSALCAMSTSTVLSQIPGFTDIRRTYYPVKLSEQFQNRPGVTRQALYEYDDADKSKVLEAWDPDRFRDQYLSTKD